MCPHHLCCSPHCGTWATASSHVPAGTVRTPGNPVNHLDWCRSPRLSMEQRSIVNPTESESVDNGNGLDMEIQMKVCLVQRRQCRGVLMVQQTQKWRGQNVRYCAPWKHQEVNQILPGCKYNLSSLHEDREIKKERKNTRLVSVHITLRCCTTTVVH